MKRRKFIQTTLSSWAAIALGGHLIGTRNSFGCPINAMEDKTGSNAKTVSAQDRVEGLLLGGLIGDALGGPIEFYEGPVRDKQLTDARSWRDERQLDSDTLQQLAETIPLHGYESLRPDKAAYGQWRSSAPAGTLTDDSRHKMILLDAVEQAQSQDRELVAEDIARAILAFGPSIPDGMPADAVAELMALDAEGFREYRMAARWSLGERDLAKALPVERLWAGVNNCSGQMMLPPLATLYAGEPEAAYRKAFEVDFIDAPMARDMAAALVAGLAAALAPELSGAPNQTRWDVLFEAMKSTDPYRFRDVPFAGRQLDKWLTKADELVQRADGRPKRLYRLLETEGKPIYWWDAHFTLLVPVCMLKMCDWNSMAAMHLTLDFGHDSDSYAQVLGCMIGAVEGHQVFAVEMIDAVAKSLERDYGRTVSQWLEIISASRASVKQ